MALQAEIVEVSPYRLWLPLGHHLIPGGLDLGHLGVVLGVEVGVVGKMLVHSVRYEELRIFGPAVEPLGFPDLVRAQRLAMRFRSVLEGMPLKHPAPPGRHPRG